MRTLYETQTPSSIHDRSWYWVRYRAEYMQMWGQWIASQGATIKMYSKTTACQIVGPIQQPEDWLASLSKAEKMGDREELVWSAEALLLRRIAEAASDIVKARHDEEFREAVGGMEPLHAAHDGAVFAYEKWFADGEG